MERIQLGAIVAVAVLVGAAVGAGVVTLGSYVGAPGTDSPAGPDGDRGPNTQSGVAAFEDASDFQAYVERGLAEADGASGWGFTFGRQTVDVTVEMSAPQREDGTASAGGSSGDGASRYSSTNVQEIGIDEPDRLKVTGEYVYYADRQRYYYAEPVFEGDVDETTVRPNHPGTTHVVGTGDPANPRKITGINGSGDLLLSGDSLVVFQTNRLVGYDVSDPTDPTQEWERRINGSVETARLANGQIYLVTRSSVTPGTVCPIEPLGGPGGAIDCSQIYHPRQQIPVDVTYTAYTLDPASGDVADSVSVVGTRDRSAIYMSENGLYITYTQRTPQGELLMDALLSSEIETPDWVDTRLREIGSYNLSARATQIEVQATVQRWFESLPAEQREQVQTDYRESLQAYVDDHKRDLVTTGVVRVGIDDGLQVDATGEVPGEPLNQFSMDEHNGTLRIATTIPRQYGTESANDLYTLDAESLQRQGAVTGMGVDERVYAVRYVDETAYVVTFRQIDPFHVIDLSDPTAPEEVGELKLPGYSSYLHPIDDDHVLGIGEEDGRVKAVLFDVSDPSDPTIDDTYYPKSRWSAIAQSHHAFLLDRKHGVFFLPGDTSGYVVDYTGGELSVQTEIEMAGQPQRAAYLDDYLYVFSDRELVVVDETDWSRETSLDLSS